MKNLLGKLLIISIVLVLLISGTKSAVLGQMETPSADFSAEPTSGSAPLEVQFTDESAGGEPTSWAWYFGDEELSADWQLVADGAEWVPREGHSSVIMPNGNIVLMGGYDGSYRNDVWRSEDGGETWQKLTENAEWPARYGHTSIVLPDGDIVLMGGYVGIGGFPYRANDVWRSDDGGETWEEVVNSAEWSVREGHSSVVLPNGDIVLIGGVSLNDVWRSDDGGETWEEVTDNAGWTARGYHTSVFMLVDERIVVMGGRDHNGNSFNDVWMSNDGGETWEELAENAEWRARRSHTSVVLPDGSILLMGGSDGAYSYTNDAWRSVDGGVSWVEVTGDAGWVGRTDHSSVVLPNGDIMMMGGYWHNSHRNDVWVSADGGETWEELSVEGEMWSGRNRHASVALPNGHILVLGGDDGSYRNDIWRSEDGGITWNEVIIEGDIWSARRSHSTVVLADGSILLLGGRDFNWDRLNDVWLSNDGGKTWNEVIVDGDIWSPRFSHSTVVLPDDSIVVIGGESSAGLRNDVWRSEDGGETWEELTDVAEWPLRYDYSTVVLPDGRIILMGGWKHGWPTIRKNDVWLSDDGGETWIQVTDSAGWSARGYHTSLILPDGNIVLFGGDDGRLRNDVWRMATAGSNEQNPQHIYTEPGTYTVTLQSFNTMGVSRIIKQDFIEVLESVFHNIFLPLILK